MNSRQQFCEPTCADQMANAERGFSAFIRVVTQQYGSEQAKLAAEDWLEELNLIGSPPLATSQNWRAVTVAASVRLASRVSVRQHHGFDPPFMRELDGSSQRQSAERPTG